ncbi:MAG: hypothetical protein KH135_05255, partial [Firmicutes bacterium]|nr:hypothetical protein [Bacillota bacterium]
MSHKLDLLKENRINTIYLDLDPKRLSEYRMFIEEANYREIDVFALIGDPSFIYEGNYPSVIQENMNLIHSFNSKMDGKARIEGIHYDVEPGGFADT